MWKNKVIWSEGAFLQAQHFQQQERYVEGLVDQRTRHLHNFDWGFSTLRIDKASLARGTVDLAQASGVFPDGTPFNLPDQDTQPAPADVKLEVRDSTVYLCLPLERQGEHSVSITQPAQPTHHRFIAHLEELPDANDGFDERSPVQLGRLNLRLLCGDGDSGAFSRIGIARIVERKADGQVVLDAAYIPPVLSVNASTYLRSWLGELRGLVRQRSETLSQRLTQPGRGGMAEVADFLLLLIVNRYTSLLDHLAAIPILHPERFYSVCLELAGQLSSFGSSRRIAHDLPRYNHDDLQTTFLPLVEQLRLSLSMVLEQTATQIELHDRKYGVRVAILNDKQLLNAASFVLAVNAQMPADVVRLRFPTQAKIGTIEKIRDLVNLQLQGIALRALPVAPRQIPYHAGFNYFELDKGNELWRQLGTSGGMAMHIAGEFPGLELELWAIRA